MPATWLRDVVTSSGPGRIWKRASFPTGAAMTVTIPWAHVLLAEMLGICWVVGAAVGVGVVLVRMRGERRGS